MKNETVGANFHDGLDGEYDDKHVFDQLLQQANKKREHFTSVLIMMIMWTTSTMMIIMMTMMMMMTGLTPMNPRLVKFCHTRNNSAQDSLQDPM
jgi:hypothetical protein